MMVRDVGHHALHRGRGVVGLASRSGAAVALRNDDAPAIGVEEHLGGVETLAVRGLPASVHAVTVDLARPYVRYEGVPVVIRAIGRWIEPDHAARSRVVLPVEEQQLHAGCLAREDAEIDAAGTDRRAQGRGSSVDARVHLGLHALVMT